MFGYVTVNKPELKIKDYNRYHGYYCGLCYILKEQDGFLGQMTLTYDMTFLVILLSSLYEPEESKMQKNCMIHPLKKHDFIYNEVTSYGADMNVALAYHNFLDDWNDEKSVKGIAGATLLKQKYIEIEKKYPRQCSVIASSLKELQQYEEKKEERFDLVSGCFGTLMAELFVFKKDRWEDTLRKLGFFLGKYIYLLDAYFDVETDIRSKSYNPLIAVREKENYEEFCLEMLTMMISEVAYEFEKLPCVLDVEILRNIIYGGVWCKYNEKRQKKGI